MKFRFISYKHGLKITGNDRYSFFGNLDTRNMSAFKFLPFLKEDAMVMPVLATILMDIVWLFIGRILR